MDQTVAIRDFLRMLRRRSPIFLLLALTGAIASVGYALMQPQVYESSAQILVKSPQIPDDLARSTVNLSAAERLQLIEQRLTSNNNLLGVIERFDLFADLPDLTQAQKIKLARAAIRIESTAVQGTGQSNAIDIFAFIIRVRLGDPEQAAAVATQFVERALSENQRARADRTRTTLEFFEREEERISATIAAVEAGIVAFKNDNEPSLPESLQFRFDQLSQLQVTELELDSRILELETALAGGETLVSGDTTPRSPEEIALRQLAMDLAQKSRVLAPTHPEIAFLQDRIAAIGDLVSTYASEPTAMATLGEPAAARTSASLRQTELLSRQISQLQEQKARLIDRRAALEASIRATPEVEVEVALNARLRNLSELQEQHRVITGRRAEARTGEALEASRQSERFEVVEDPQVPDRPLASDRKKIAVLGGGSSVALAFGLLEPPDQAGT